MDPLEEKIEAQGAAARKLGAQIEAFKRRVRGHGGDFEALLTEADNAIRETLQCLEAAGLPKRDVLDVQILLRELVHSALMAGYEHCRARKSP